MKTLAAKGRLEQMKYLEHTITTYMWNICNIQIKSLQHTSGTDKIFWTNSCDMSLKHLQHIQYVQHPQSTFATSIWNNGNASEMSETLKTYIYNIGDGVPVPVNFGRRGGSRRWVAACEHHWHPVQAARASTTTTSAVSTGLGPAGRASRATGGASTTSISARDERVRGARDEAWTSDSRWARGSERSVGSRPRRGSRKALREGRRKRNE
jgi:hypothetical protein